MFKKIIVFTLVCSLYLHAIEEQAIKPTMNAKVNQVLSVLKDSSLSQAQKEQQSTVVMDGIFDYDTMSQISLGKYWNKLSQNEKKEFSKAFENKIKLSYVDKLRLYNNQKVIMKEMKKIKPNRITFEAEVIGLNDTYKVVYLFYKNAQNNEWYIYDVDLVGVSIVQTYRKQFSEFLKTKSIQQLIASL